jgi:hypothetical protein
MKILRLFPVSSSVLREEIAMDRVSEVMDIVEMSQKGKDIRRRHYAK